MIDGVTNGIILLVISSMIFNLCPDDQTSPPPPPFLLLSYAFFLAINNTQPVPPNLNTIQPPTINLATTTLSLSTFMF
jgi:hypothetical protein